MSKTITRDAILNHLHPFRGKKHIVGVDAGANTGLAAWDVDQKEWVLQTLDFWQAHDLITSLSRDITGIVIEVPTGHVVHRRFEGKNAGHARDRMAANVGGARREAVLLAERFEAMGFAVVRVRPSATKWTRADVAFHTGIEKPTNEHCRDAVRLVYSQGFGVVR